MTLREISTDQLQTVQDLAYAIWPETYGQILSKEQLHYMLSAFYSIGNLTQKYRDGHRFVLVENSEKPLGFLSYEHQYQGRPVTRIHKIYVLPETQGSGIGKMLLQHAERLARDQGSQWLSLNVNRFNKALGFYQKIGFVITGEEDIDIGRGYLMEDYKMEKPL